MKLVTYNIWNKDVDIKNRMEKLSGLLKESTADLICLQEVAVDENQWFDMIRKGSGYPYYSLAVYPDSPDEGLGILSKQPLNNVHLIWCDETLPVSSYCAMYVEVEVDNVTVGVTNVHLNWRSEEIRLAQMKDVMEWLSRHDLLKDVI